MYRFPFVFTLISTLVTALMGCARLASAAERDGASLAAFDASQVTVVQSSNSFAATGRVAWVPGYYVTPWLGFRADLGVALLKESSNSELETEGGLYAATSVAALADFVLGSLSLSGGGGVAFWHDRPFSRAPLLTGRIAWLLDGDWVDRVYLGYSYLRFEAVHTREIALGLGFKL